MAFRGKLKVFGKEQVIKWQKFGHWVWNNFCPASTMPGRKDEIFR